MHRKYQHRAAGTTSAQACKTIPEPPRSDNIHSNAGVGALVRAAAPGAGAAVPGAEAAGRGRDAAAQALAHALVALQ